MRPSRRRRQSRGRRFDPAGDCGFILGRPQSFHAAASFWSKVGGHCFFGFRSDGPSTAEHRCKRLPRRVYSSVRPRMTFDSWQNARFSATVSRAFKCVGTQTPTRYLPDRHRRQPVRRRQSDHDREGLIANRSAICNFRLIQELDLDNSGAPTSKTQELIRVEFLN